SNENEEQQNNRRETRKRRRSRNDSTSSTSSNVSKKVVGLKNLGNTCFMNAVLQSLSNIQEFSHFFKQLPAITEISTKQNGGGGRMVGSLRERYRKASPYYHQQSLKDLNNHLMVEELRKVFICLTDHHLADNKSAISPEELFVVIWKVMPSRFGWFRQQDAHEFLRYTLDRVHNELVHLPDSVTIATEAKEEGGGGGKDTKPSIVTNIFGGALLSEVKCLKSFVEVEELAETEIYNCNNCKSKQSGDQKFWFKRLPNVLCLHLKRFRWTNANASWTKVDTMIDFPVSSLDMSAYILPEPSDPQTGRPSSKPSAPPGGHLDSNIYDLAAVIVHHGTGVHSGHYTAYAIHEAQWWHFDDSTVMPVDIPALKKCKPYILFYVRRVPEVTKK
ncbi:ubiquitin carboxyl-terminal hydrolase 3-like, partial [Diaphorina citri]|uniref:Ubiquitin carboxyl-terminal hydrolase n=1 Tax=Diaphorina citri TaxID=121845 RepID=A0A1S4EJJ6_DIACI